MANPPKIRHYDDLRFKFVRGLIKHEHQQRRHQFLKQAAEWTSKAIVSLSLESDPVRSAKQATLLEGVGATIRARLDKIQKENTCRNDPPIPGHHISTGSGLLVALLNESEAIGSTEGGKPLVSESDLKEACSLICEEKFNEPKPSAYGAPVLCPAWWRINVLIGRGYVKKRTRGKKAVYELLPEGEEIARRLRGNHLPPIRIRNHSPPPTKTAATPKQSSKKPAKKKTPVSTFTTNSSSSLSSSPSKVDAGPLYSYDNGSDGVLLIVDDHELGGDRMRLGELSRKLKQWNVQHKTGHLPCGDYSWLWRHKSGEVTLPVLVERKRADDLAESIKDGRFCSQKDKMKQWRKEFGILSDEVCLHYIVESTPEAYCVRCMDGCGGVGKCGNPTVEQLEVVIMELERSCDFNLIRTENIETTVEFLASVTAELEQRVNSGDFEALRLMKQGISTTANKKTATSTTTHLSSKNSTTSVTKTTDFTSHFNSPSPSRSDYDYAYAVSTATSSSSQSHLNSPTREIPKHSWSPSRPGNKRRLADFSFDDDIEHKPVKCKPEVIDLCDSQDSDIILSPFDNKKSPFSNSWNDSRAGSKEQSQTNLTTNWNARLDVNQNEKANAMSVHDINPDAKYGTNARTNQNNHRDIKYDVNFQTTNQNTQRDVKFDVNTQAANQNADVDVSQDEEAKIMSVRDVIPNASLDDILSALSSCAGNVEYAVAKLLDEMTN